MFPRLSSLLSVLSATGIGLLSYNLSSSRPTATAAAGLALVVISSLGYVLTLRRMQNNAFRTAMSTYADKQMQLQRNSHPAVPSFDASSTAV
jgi:hypothetical protein